MESRTLILTVLPSDTVATKEFAPASAPLDGAAPFDGVVPRDGLGAACEADGSSGDTGSFRLSRAAPIMATDMMVSRIPVMMLMSQTTPVMIQAFFLFSG